MSALTNNRHATPLTRRTMLKSLAGGAAALFATAHIASASSPRANRETGSAPVVSGLDGFIGDAERTAARKKFERRSPE